MSRTTLTLKCSDCGADRPIDEFHNQTRALSGKQSKCKVCRRLYDRSYYRDHRRKRNKQMRERDATRTDEKRASARERRETIRDLPTRLTKAERDAFVESIGECMGCGATENLTFDHVIPLSMGGDDSLANAGALCGSCNIAKRNKPFDYRDAWKSQKEKRARYE